jgi:hypothetical protein
MNDFVTVDEYCKVAFCCRQTAYYRIRRLRIRARKYNGRWLILKKSLPVKLQSKFR